MKIYYAHHRWKYGTEIEIYEQNLIKATFPGDTIVNPSKDIAAISYWLDKDPKYRPDEDFVMDKCLTEVASSDMLVFSSVDGVIGHGVYEEVCKAKMLGKPVYYIYQDELTQDFSITLKEYPVTDRLFAIVGSKVFVKHCPYIENGYQTEGIAAQVALSGQNTNMQVKDLKNIIDQLPDDMPVIIPVIDEDDANRIYGFRYVRTAGVLTCDSEREREVLCLNSAANGNDIVDQVYFSGRDVGVKSILFGVSKYDKKEKEKEKEND